MYIQCNITYCNFVNTAQSYLYSDFVWAQEEHRNQGAWNFVNTRFENVVGIKVWLWAPVAMDNYDNILSTTENVLILVLTVDLLIMTGLLICKSLSESK